MKDIFYQDVYLLNHKKVTKSKKIHKNMRKLLKQNIENLWSLNLLHQNVFICIICDELEVFNIKKYYFLLVI